MGQHRFRGELVANMFGLCYVTWIGPLLAFIGGGVVLRQVPKDLSVAVRYSYVMAGCSFLLRQPRMWLRMWAAEQDRDCKIFPDPVKDVGR